MGCDIHAYIEHKPKNRESWQSFGGRINPGRIYGMFAKLADVRNTFGIKPISEPRGIPDGISSGAFEDYTMYITETEGENYVTTERAAAWVKDGSSKYLRNDHFVSNPDWHSESWCNADELEQAITDVWRSGFNGCEVEWKVLVATMRSFEQQGEDARLVFWFDN